MFDKAFKKRQKGRYCSDGQCTRKHRKHLIPGSYAHDLPVPIKIDPYKQKKHRRVRIAKISTHGESERQSKFGKLLLVKKNRQESYSESEKGCCGLTRWCAKRKALKELEAEKKNRAKQAEEWRKWKLTEGDRLERAEHAKAELEREQEYLKQIQEIEEQRRKLAKNTLKARHPTPSKRVVPKESFKDNLSIKPYYPKRIEYDPSDDDFVKSKKERKQEKKELKKWEKEEKKRQKSNLVPLVEKPLPDCKCSKFKSYLNKIKGKDKKDETSTTYFNYDEIYNDKKRNKKEKEQRIYSDPYLNFKEDKPDPYKDLYDKPYESKKPKNKDSKSYTDVYPYYDNHKYDPPTKVQCEPTCSRRKSQDDDDLYSRYYELYGGESSSKNIKQKKTKTKNQKITKTDLEKKKSCDFSQKFVNCFYRTCCECYCWFSIFLMIGIALIMVV